MQEQEKELGLVPAAPVLEGEASPALTPETLAYVGPEIAAICARIEPVGSRVTCNPPPTDTDVDFLCLVPKDKMEALFDALDAGNWSMDGSDIGDAPNYLPEEAQFQSYKRGAVNVIVTRSQTFFDRFMAASHCAKRFNLLKKDDRITLFQAVLYGRAYVPETFDFMPDDAFAGALS